MQALQQKAFVGKTAELRVARQGRTAVRAPVAVRAEKQEVDRRAALGLLAGAAALIAGAKPSEAAYGDAARVFAGGPTNTTGFTPYAGDGFALLIPSKWGPSKERDFPNTIFRYQDSFDDVNNVLVISEPVSASNIEGLGSIDKFLQDKSYLFGSASWFGETASEGGFKPNSVAVNSILEVEEATDKKGRKYYKYHVLSRAADGNEGARHQLVAATVADNKLWIVKVQVGDKRWVRDERRNAETLWNSFTVA